MFIRQETQSDVQAIADITKAAFENHPYGNNTEQFIINNLRAANALTISLVAQMEEKLVGHIAFSPVTFSDGSENWYGLGPVSVLPDYQKQGVGTKLVNDGLHLLKGLGAKGCVLVGDPNFYERFSFRSPDGLKYEGVPQENFLALSFCNRIPTGIVKFHQAFSATE
ncbi:MAG: GNAT family N-acetyltransferase [Planctomycetota bacterium]|jgi:putative acetyltransferase